MKTSYPDPRRRCTRAVVTCILSALGLLALPACTAESTRLALQTQRRADDVQQALFERQQDGLRALLFRDLQRRLEQNGAPLAPAQLAALNSAWNERDLLEFWAVQQERARALRLVGVDAKLFGDQSIVDLLVKSVAARADRAAQGLAAAAGARIPADAGIPPDDHPPATAPPSTEARHE